MAPADSDTKTGHRSQDIDPLEEMVFPKRAPKRDELENTRWRRAVWFGAIAIPLDSQLGSSPNYSELIDTFK
jgi:hypothetical protein